VRIAVSPEQLGDYPDADIIVTGFVSSEGPAVESGAEAPLVPAAEGASATPVGDTAVENPTSGADAFSVSGLFHNEVWEAEPAVVPEKEPESLQQLRKELSETREYAASAEEILNRVSREKITNELALLKKIREAEALSREFAGKTKAREDEVAALHDAIRGLETRVGELGAALAAKDAECRAVRSSREAETAPLLAKIELLERQTGDLTFMLTSKTGEFQAVIHRKDAELDAQRGKIQALEKQAGALSAELTTKTNECQALSASKEVETESLLKQVLDLEAELHELAATLKGKEAAHQSALQGKDGEISSLLAKLQEREEQSFKLAVEIKAWGDKMMAVTAKETQLKSLYDSLELNLKKEIDEHQKLLASLRRQLQAA
jgi:chromosome segregation ATPase